MPRTVPKKRSSSSKRASTSLVPYGTPPRVRLLPITIASLSLLFMAKMVDIYERGNAFSEMMLGGAAYAEDAPKEEAKENKEATKEDDAKKDASDSTDKEQAPKDKDASKDAKKEPTSKKDKTSKDEPSDKKMQLASQDARQFSTIELDILQSLSKRREDLEKLEKQVSLKENLLNSTEVRLDQKISQIQTMEKTLRDLLGTYDKQEEAKIRSLVKIYENMKPKEAARIFDEMQMPILLMVVDKMSERRAAPILAKMSPVKAKDLTQELAEDRAWRDQQEQQLNTIQQ